MPKLSRPSRMRVSRTTAVSLLFTMAVFGDGAVACSSSDDGATSGSDSSNGGVANGDPNGSSGNTKDGGNGSGNGDAGGGSNGDGGTVPVPPGSTPVAFHGALHVTGGKVVGSQGPVALRGMSFFWSQWSDTFWNASAVDQLVDDWHVTVVRAAMGVAEGGYIGNEAREKARVKTIVDAAVARGVYVIVDWHDHDANQRTEAAKTFFREMADSYGNTPNVIFEIWNEPIEVPWSTVKSYANSVLAEIRGRNAQNLVIVGSPHWSQDVDQAALDPLADTNVAYTIHFYANTAAHQQPLRDKAQVAIDKGLALFSTEWGTSSADGNGGVNEGESQVWLDFLKAHDIGWCNWSLFDKAEASAALVPGSSPTGPWPETSLTSSGKFVKGALSRQ